MDSSACAVRYVNEGCSVEGIFIDYGQPAAEQEARAAANVAGYLNVKLHVVRVSGVTSRGVGYVPGRNALLIHLGVASLSEGVGLLAIGLISGSHYVDCTPTFVSTAQRTLDLYFDGRLQLAAPLIDQPKGRVVSELAKTGFPIGITYSCEAGTIPVCGACLSCRDRGAA